MLQPSNLDTAGKSFWLPANSSTRLNTNVIHSKKLSVDYLVVGAGITGALIAHKLITAGYSVAIIDKSKPALGATALSTALVQYEIDLPLTRLIEKIGKEAAISIWQRNYQCVQKIASLCQTLDKDVAATFKNTLYLDGNLLNQDELYQEYQHRKQAGFDVEFLDRKSLDDQYGIQGRSAIRSHHNLAINPQIFTLSLLDKVVEKGAILVSDTSISTLNHISNTSLKITTTSQHQINAKHLIYATGYAIPKEVNLLNIKKSATWVITTQTQSKGSLWADEAFIWEASDPYLYIRTTVDGKIICGGEDACTYTDEEREALTPIKEKILEEKLHQLFPNVQCKSVKSWSAPFNETPLSLPLIGALPGQENCYVALCYGGNGITFAHLAAEVLLNLTLGHGDKELKWVDINQAS